MRDTLRTKEYFDTFILEELEDIKMFEDSIENGEIEDERINFIKDDILEIKLGIIIAKYSRGDPICTIKKEFEDMIDFFCEFWNGEIYEDNLWFASLAYLLKLDEALLKRIRNKLKESDTYDYLIDFILIGFDDSQDNLKISFPRPYKKLLKCINGQDREALLKYLRGWYKGCQESSWYDTHKIKDDNLYFGYWCFEAGAVAKRLGFEDDDLKNKQYYPYDMIHYIE
ncbi:DUF1911-domain-containing protein [Anaeromyces robustus]|uniref:DUF1911-domain-containing protein n=1 Tax=Anaeromyces robustus TaxID=1754192 RepID=A0A1Y1WT76_9FUNG|nr:DUF1911-domain-containing protein [Anaeromyces robustus]|eukprot:ORX76344.1 DUF1911-domain-containing protein [Anaeromyces robustus]